MRSVPRTGTLTDLSTADLVELGVDTLTPAQRHELEQAVNDFVASVRQALTPAILEEMRQMNQWIDKQRLKGMTPTINALTIHDLKLLGYIRRRGRRSGTGRTLDLNALQSLYDSGLSLEDCAEEMNWKRSSFFYALRNARDDGFELQPRPQSN